MRRFVEAFVYYCSYSIQLVQIVSLAVTKHTLATSHEGRSIDVLVVREPGSAAKPGIWLDCGIHAREWVSPPACLHIVDTLVQDSNAVDPRDNLLRDCA